MNEAQTKLYRDLFMPDEDHFKINHWKKLVFQNRKKSLSYIGSGLSASAVNDEEEGKTKPCNTITRVLREKMEQKFIEYISYKDQLYMVIKATRQHDQCPLLQIYPFDAANGATGEAILLEHLQINATASTKFIYNLDSEFKSYK